MKTIVNILTMKSFFTGFFIALTLFLSASFTEGNQNEWRLIREAVKHENLELVFKFIEQNPLYLYITDEERGENLLHLAARYGNVKIAALLINEGISVKIKSKKKGYTPLHLAAHHGKVEMVDLFLKAGSSVNVKSN